MICPNCGSNNPDGTAFCANCGSPVSNGAPNNGAIPPQAQPNFQGSAPNGGMTPPPVFNGNRSRADTSSRETLRSASSCPSSPAASTVCTGSIS
ncbi:MAG: zinc-ribbon domain-containing protein [Ruminococcus sp.]